jgi:hypothetical protein
MKQLFEKLVVVGIILAFLCLAAGQALAKNPERPYHGRAEATLVSVGVCDPGTPGIFPSQLWEGTSIATHTGRGEGFTCTVATAFVGPLAIAAAGQGVSTAANGDQAYYTIDGVTDFSSDPCVGVFTIVVDGGTGRFADASGVIQAVVISPWSAPFSCGTEQSTTLNGTIAY